MGAEQDARISVIMIISGTKKGLQRRLDSVLDQLSGRDELLMVVGCEESAQPSCATARDSRVKIASQEGTNLPRRIEAALRQASGDYIFLAESCDTWHPGKRAACVAALDEGATAVIHDAIIVDGGLNEIDSSLLRHRFRTGWLPNLFRNRLIGCCMAFHREVLAAALPFPPRVSLPDWCVGVAAGNMGRVAFIARSLIFFCSRNTAAGKRRFFRQRKRPGLGEVFFLLLLSRRIGRLRSVNRPHME